MEDLLRPFVDECRELTTQAGQDLAGLRQEGDDAGLIDSAFRAFHTLKGSAALMGFQPLERLMHAAEDALSAVRGGHAKATEAVLAELTAALDLTDRWLDVVDAQGALPADAAETAAPREAALRSVLHLVAGGAEAEAAPVEQEADRWWGELVQAAGAPDGGAAMVAIRYRPDAGAFFRGEDPLALLRATPDLLALRLRPREPWPAPELLDPFQCNLEIEALSAAAPEAVRAAFRLVADQVDITVLEPRGRSAAEAPQSLAARAAPGVTARTLRVEAARIDGLAATVDELIVAKNAIAHLVRGRSDGSERALAEAQARLDRLVANLHADVTRMRLVPLAPLFGRFPRVVRETAASLGKAVELEMSGEGVEVDKAVADALYEPLLHMLRNALDHGLETPADRQAAGKPATGRLILRASLDGDQVAIEVADDGRGIDPASIRRAAVAKGLRTAAEAERLNDADALELIFAPGFSTAGKIGQLSGRGVGMDAVRNAAAALGGRAAVSSTPGQGTSVRLLLPARVVLTRIMSVRAGDESFGVALDAVVETARVQSDQIQAFRAGRAFVLRDRPVPLIHLADLLGLGEAGGASEQKVLVVRLGDDLVGVAVDGFGERFDAPLRPMTGLLAGMPGVLGSTLLGDGRVLVVLDLPELIG